MNGEQLAAKPEVDQILNNPESDLHGLCRCAHHDDTFGIKDRAQGLVEPLLHGLPLPGVDDSHRPRVRFAIFPNYRMGIDGDDGAPGDNQRIDVEFLDSLAQNKARRAANGHQYIDQLTGNGVGNLDLGRPGPGQVDRRDHLPAIGFREGREAERHVAAFLHCGAAGPEHDDRTEYGIAHGADDDFGAGRDHGLDDDPLDSGIIHGARRGDDFLEHLRGVIGADVQANAVGARLVDDIR